MRRIAEKMATIDKLPADRASALKSLCDRDMVKLKQQRSAVKKQVAEIKTKMDKIVNHPGPAGKAKKVRAYRVTALWGRASAEKLLRRFWWCCPPPPACC
jgi:chorismate mutase